MPAPASVRRQTKESNMDGLLGGAQQAIAAAILMFGIVGAAGTTAAQTEQGVANFYCDQCQGRKTASGEAFDKNGLTAAHKKLPFGTKVKVTNVDNGKSVVVTVNDRMGASSPAVIDVTRRAADELDFTKAGTAKGQGGSPEVGDHRVRCRKAVTARTSLSGCSYGSMWPASPITSTRACGISVCQRSA